MTWDGIIRIATPDTFSSDATIGKYFSSILCACRMRLFKKLWIRKDLAQLAYSASGCSLGPVPFPRKGTTVSPMGNVVSKNPPQLCKIARHTATTLFPVDFSPHTLSNWCADTHNPVPTPLNAKIW